MDANGIFEIVARMRGIQRVAQHDVWVRVKPHAVESRVPTVAGDQVLLLDWEVGLGL